jgi:hypothetical protein
MVAIPDAASPEPRLVVLYWHAAAGDKMRDRLRSNVKRWTDRPYRIVLEIEEAAGSTEGYTRLALQANLGNPPLVVVDSLDDLCGRMDSTRPAYERLTALHVAGLSIYPLRAPALVIAAGRVSPVLAALEWSLIRDRRVNGAKRAAGIRASGKSGGRPRKDGTPQHRSAT